MTFIEITLIGVFFTLWVLVYVLLRLLASFDLSIKDAQLRRSSHLVADEQGLVNNSELPTGIMRFRIEDLNHADSERERLHSMARRREWLEEERGQFEEV